MKTKKVHYVISLEIANLNFGNLDKAQKSGEIILWDFRNIESCHPVREDGTVNYGE